MGLKLYVLHTFLSIEMILANKIILYLKTYVAQWF